MSLMFLEMLSGDDVPEGDGAGSEGRTHGRRDGLLRRGSASFRQRRASTGIDQMQPVARIYRVDCEADMSKLPVACHIPTIGWTRTLRLKPPASWRACEVDHHGVRSASMQLPSPNFAHSHLSCQLLPSSGAYRRPHLAAPVRNDRSQASANANLIRGLRSRFDPVLRASCLQDLVSGRAEWPLRYQLRETERHDLPWRDTSPLRPEHPALRDSGLVQSPSQSERLLPIPWDLSSLVLA